MEVVIKESYEQMSALGAEIVARIVRNKPRSVIGLATGSTPLGIYRELIRMHKDEGLSFFQVVTFNLDEYIGLPPEHPQSYRYFINQNLLDHINVKKENTYLPDGMAENIELACIEYEKKIEEAGGIDLQILGIGSNGHIAFNEPGSSLGSRTRIETLSEETIQNNSRFFPCRENVPRHAITMGIGTIMDARELILLANGEEKAGAVASMIEGPITAMVPATVVQLHRKTTVIVERAAAGRLSRCYPGELQVIRMNRDTK
ncbi:MAG: Glucosamine-6-phosphate deaminase 1 [Syntrophomonadaceae bacterium]|nr:Glucosamine-6-phosphate deaminase 1 [Bacillota bacterium]MBT9146668.1 Glucosamine-6-phosphate deaminase 1 [Bacillota bacterium]